MLETAESSLDVESATAVLNRHLPDLDVPITDYIIAFLRDPTSDAYDETGPHDFLLPLLFDICHDSALCDRICAELDVLVPKHERIRLTIAPVKLDQPVMMHSADATVIRTGRVAELEWVVSSSTRKGVSIVDEKKLERAEAKIRQKLERRERKTNYEASRLLRKKDDDPMLAGQAVNPILDYTTTRGKAKDVRLESFDITYSGKRILTNANLTLAFGRRYGLIGRNGIGKSTLLRNIARRDLPVPAQVSILHVEQEMHGDDTSAVQAVLQADYFREHLLREEERIQEDLTKLEAAAEANEPAGTNGIEEESLADRDKRDVDRNRLTRELNQVHIKLGEIESDKAESRAAAILRGLGFRQEELGNPTRTFSGGWRMRLSLARALFCKPDLLLLDEPTNMLDIPAVAWLESYLQTWPNTLLVVSHDREFLDAVCTDILHQHSERLDPYRGNYAQFHATRTERRRNMKREYESQLQYRKHLQEFIDKFRYNASKAAQAQMKLKILEKLPVLEPVEDDLIVTFRFPEPDAISPPILQMNDVDFAYPGTDRVILSDVNFDMQMDSRIAVVGPNGAGKSTMLKLMTGQLEPRHGIVHRHGRLRVALFTQHHVDQLDMDASPVGYLAKRFPGKPEEEYRRQLGHFGLSGTLGLQSIRTLSGGQKSRVAFACLALQQPHILILDEPTNHLDMDSIEALTQACRAFLGGIVLVSHDERFIDAVCTQIWVCADGRVVQFAGDTIKEYKKLILPAEV